MKIAINKQLLPVKFHYFFFFAGVAFVMPFLADFAVNLGIRPTVIAVIFTVMPFTVLLTKSMCSSFADRIQKHKTVIIITISITAVSYFSVGVIPQADFCSNKLQTTCTDNTSNIILCGSAISQCHNGSNFAEDIACSLTCSGCHSVINSSCNQNNSFSEFLNTSTMDSCLQISSISTISQNLLVKTCASNQSDCQINCFCPSLSSNVKEHSIYYRWDIVLMFICMIISYNSASFIVSLSDTITLDLLKEEKNKYGQQRLWGTIGWGLSTIIAGEIQNATTEENCLTNYTYGFYILLILLILDMIILTQANVKSNPKPKQIVKNIATLYKSPTIIVFSLAVFVMGFMTGPLWSYLVVYIKHTLKGSSFLTGLAMGTQCFGGELLVFLFSGAILQRLGHIHSMTLCLGVYGLRFISYSFIVNPWTILPVEFTNGITFGLFFATMASYASLVAPPGTSATMQGILQSIFEGVGVGLGSLTFWSLLEIYDGRTAFLIFGIIASVCCLLYGIVMTSLLHNGEFHLVQQDSEEPSIKTELESISS